MSDLRLLLRIGKTSRCAIAIVVALAIGGLCMAGETTTRPAPIGYNALSDNGGVDLTGLMWQMFAAALMVLAVGGLSLFVIKRLVPRIRRTSHRQISVLETAYLGSRKAVHLLQVGSVRLLVASSSEGVVRLDDVTGAFAPEYSDIALRVGAEMDTSDRSGDSPEDFREAD